MRKLAIDDENAALYSVGQVAGMLQVRQAFLRRLDREEVVQPARSDGGQRRYSRRQIRQIAEVIDLVDEGVTLAGVRHVLALRQRIAELEADLDAARHALASLRSSAASHDDEPSRP